VSTPLSPMASHPVHTDWDRLYLAIPMMSLLLARSQISLLYHHGGGPGLPRASGLRSCHIVSHPQPSADNKQVRPLAILQCQRPESCL